jgi:hypothetical protein
MYVEYQRDAFVDFVHACVYGSLDFSAERFRYVKELHEENVRSYFLERPDDFLVLDVFAPWPPLRRFLGVAQPDAPFPHVNKALSNPAVKRESKRGPRLLGRRRQA